MQGAAHLVRDAGGKYQPIVVEPVTSTQCKVWWDDEQTEPTRTPLHELRGQRTPYPSIKLIGPLGWVPFNELPKWAKEVVLGFPSMQSWAETSHAPEQEDAPGKAPLEDEIRAECATMSALRRMWQPTMFSLTHDRFQASARRVGERWEWVAWEGGDSQTKFGNAPTLAEAQAAAENEIEHRLQRLTREEIIMEMANTDCRKVEP